MRVRGGNAVMDFLAMHPLRVLSILHSLVHFNSFYVNIFFNLKMMHAVPWYKGTIKYYLMDT